VTELTHLAAAGRDGADAARATARLTDDAVFLKTLPPLDRAEEPLTLAQGWALAGESLDGKVRARAALDAVLAAAERADPPEPWRKPRVRALPASAALAGK
jgi:hypothetical protein